MSKEKTPTQYQKRLFKQLKNIEDDNIREMIFQAIYVEYKYRSSGRFPIQRIRDLVDNYAGLLDKGKV